MDGERFDVAVRGGHLVGVRYGDGTPVLLLHGGPGIGGELMIGLVDELVPGYEVAWYNQRGLPPSTARGPYDLPTQVDDVVAVLDHLGWERAVVMGFSFGGHLLLHLQATYPERLLASVPLDPMGGVGDGGMTEFGARIDAGTPEWSRARAAEIDAMDEADLTDDLLAESLALVWPAYFADPATAPAAPAAITASAEAHRSTFESADALLPELATRLADSGVRTLFLHGGASPIPLSASHDSADAIGSSASVTVVPGSGHFLWLESPGAVRRALDNLLAP